MKILINASNLKKGGGLQVADSICSQLIEYTSHTFVVVVSKQLEYLVPRIAKYHNVKAIRYDIKDTITSLLFGRNQFLDSLVDNEKIKCVLTIFGPSRWSPRVPHLEGFARPHIVLRESPFFKRMPLFQKLRVNLKLSVLEFLFKKGSKYFYTENEYITKLLKKKWKNKQISTITNYYNQVFDCPENWADIHLPNFDGITIVTISANYPHKNLEIIVQIAKNLKAIDPNFKFRFVITINSEELYIPPELKENIILIGNISINQCPSLYKLSDISFQPSLLECFSATYPESMRMNIPILTTDLAFAHGLCQDSALYYSPENAREAAEHIIELAKNKSLRNKLIERGSVQLEKFDNYVMRTKKLITLCENIVCDKELNVYD